MLSGSNACNSNSLQIVDPFEGKLPRRLKKSYRTSLVPGDGTYYIISVWWLSSGESASYLYEHFILLHSSPPIAAHTISFHNN